MNIKPLKRAALAGAIASAVACPALAVDYEVWVSDQTNSKGLSASNNNGTHGGFLRIYEGSCLDSNPVSCPSNGSAILDVGDLFPTALANTGSNVVRIHGMLPSPNHNYINLNFVTSGHIGIIDTRTRTAVALFRTTKTSSGQQNHLALWTPDGKYLLVANQNGKMLERIKLTWDASGQNLQAAEYEAAASLDLKGGAGRILAQPSVDATACTLPGGCTISGVVADGQSTLTPNGVLKEGAAGRDNNAVICPAMVVHTNHAFATLAGGGLFVVDYTAAPMRIVAEYDDTTVHAAGCGGVEMAGAVYANAGVWAANTSEFTLYKFPTAWPSAPAYYPVNTPKPKVVYADPSNGAVTAPVNSIVGSNRDAHGFGLNASKTFLHQFDRVKNNVEVFHLGTGARNTYWLTTTDGNAPGPGNAGTACGTTVGAQENMSTTPPTGANVYNDPSPDLLDLAPDGSRFFVANRGPKPLSVAHAAAGSCPSLGVVSLSQGGKHGVMGTVLNTTWMNYDNTVNISDPHAAVVVLQ